MKIAQRGTSATITGANAYHTVDRFLMNIETTNFNSIGTMGQNLDSLTHQVIFQIMLEYK